MKVLEASSLRTPASTCSGGSPLHLTCVRNQTSQPAVAAMIKKHAGMIMIEFATMGALLSYQGGSAIGLSATDALG